MDLLNTALCWIILFAKVVTMQSLKCDAGEYEINNECCPMCPPGSVVRSHCTTDSSTVCVPCITQTYMDHPNGVSKCLRCKICDKGAALVTQKGCTYNSNTICECEAGHFCPEEDGKECNLCQQHTICQPGEWVEKLGTARTNTMCEICPLDTFSNESMSKTCIPWRKCSIEDLTQDKAGTSISDSTCKNNKRKRVFFIFTIVVLLICVGGIGRIIYRFVTEEPIEAKSNKPTQETGC